MVEWKGSARGDKNNMGLRMIYCLIYMMNRRCSSREGCRRKISIQWTSWTRKLNELGG
jgi:hypothetical protein